MQKHVNLVDLVKSFPTSIYYYSVVFSFAKFGFDTAESTAAAAEKEPLKDCLIFTYM